MRDTWLALMEEIPRAEATFSTFRVETPQVTISDIAAITARSVLE